MLDKARFTDSTGGSWKTFFLHHRVAICRQHRREYSRLILIIFRRSLYVSIINISWSVKVLMECKALVEDCYERTIQIIKNKTVSVLVFKQQQKKSLKLPKMNIEKINENRSAMFEC